MDKITTRAQILEDFVTIPAAERVDHSEAIARAVLALPELEGSRRSMMAFLSMSDELDTTPLLRGALEAGFELYAPRTLRRSRRLIPTRLPSLDSVRSGAYGIREPTSDHVVEPEQLGVVIVPAVAFDRRGWRLGRGGGYYDRFLERLAPDAVTCGVVFSRHLLDQVPTEPHDRPVQIVVTEQEDLRFRHSAESDA